MTARYEYRCIPATVAAPPGMELARFAANTMQNTCMQQMAEGFEFHATVGVTTVVQPGCLGSLFGATTTYVQIGVMVFRRQVA